MKKALLTVFLFLEQNVWVKKSGYCKIKWNGRDHGTSEINQWHQRPGLYTKKVMCIWWDWKGVFYYELLPENQMINSNKHLFQIDKLKALNEKCPELVNRKSISFHQNNARPHVYLMTRQKLLQLGWEVLIHMFYPPDIAPLNSHLFQFLHNSLNGKNFNFLEDCKSLWNSSLLKKIKSLGKMELWICLKNSGRWSNKTMNTIVH